MKKLAPILLDIGAISIAGCWHLFKKGDVEVCVYGSGLLAGCKDECAIASVPNPGDLIIGGEFTVSGTLVNSETGRTVQAVPVSLVMPNRARYSTRSDPGGRFKIIVKPDSRIGDREPFRVTLEFARMETMPEAGEIVLFGDFTTAFRKTHPELTFLQLRVSDFSGHTVYT